jgi:hypothetical protein
VEGALKEIASISNPNEAFLPAGNLFRAVAFGLQRSLDPTSFRLVLSEYLKAIRNRGGSPDDYYSVAQAEQDNGVMLDSQDPILAAKRVVLQLERLPEIQAMASVKDGHSLRADGRGVYRAREKDTFISADSYSAVVCAGQCGSGTLPAVGNSRPLNRALLVDLSKPVPGGGSVPREVVRGATFGSFLGQDDSIQMLALNGTLRPGIRRVKHIPVGKTVISDRTEIRFFIGTIQHILQFGPWTAGEYQATNQAVFHGDGTTRASITRQSATSWVVRSAPHSVGRLWDNRDPTHPVDLGLYYFSFRVQFSQMPVH